MYRIAIWAMNDDIDVALIQHTNTQNGEYEPKSEWEREREKAREKNCYIVNNSNRMPRYVESIWSNRHELKRNSSTFYAMNAKTQKHVQIRRDEYAILECAICEDGLLIEQIETFRVYAAPKCKHILGFWPHLAYFWTTKQNFTSKNPIEIWVLF